MLGRGEMFQIEWELLFIRILIEFHPVPTRLLTTCPCCFSRDEELAGLLRQPLPSIATHLVSAIQTPKNNILRLLLQ